MSPSGSVDMSRLHTLIFCSRLVEFEEAGHAHDAGVDGA